jgi:hypothetical protein
MAVSKIVRTDVRYVLTDQGREDLLRAQTCPCSQLFVTDGVYQCLVCQTVYSVVFGFSVPQRKLRRRAEGASE